MASNRIIAAAATLFALLPLAAYAQAGQPKPEPATFAAADVHPSPTRLHPEVHGGISRGGLFRLRDATLVDLISQTYDVDPSSVFGGPGWLEFDRFDILAKPPAGTTDQSVKPMLGALLADRFKLIARPGVRPLPAFVLSAGKAVKLKKADPSAQGDYDCQYQAPPKNASPAAAGTMKFACHNLTMEMFAGFLHEAASPYLPRPVVNSTGLEGRWDFEIQWTYQMPKEGGGISIFDAVDKQLGLKLEAKTAPLPVVVVESVNEKPTPNAANLDKILPAAPPAQFEVAVIRPANPTERNYNVDTQPGGRVTIQHASLQTLIYTSWDINPGKILNKPNFLNTNLYDITGKAAIEAPLGMGGIGPSGSVDEEEVKEMVRSLLADRFKMAYHMEDRPADVFALVAANPKMKKADPANHPSCHEGPGPDGKDPRLDNPSRSRLISCQNMTMAQLTTELASLASGYLPAPVIDASGLTGAYDFSISFSKRADLKRTDVPAPSVSVDPGLPGASDPGGQAAPISLFDAIQKQLGLKLEKRDKVPSPVLVIDHIEEKPTEN